VWKYTVVLAQEGADQGQGGVAGVQVGEVADVVGEE
jgi:hypothetical protein